MRDLDKLVEEANLERQGHAKQVLEILQKGDHLDDDGYPTEDALLAIELWDWEHNGGSKGWFDFIQSIWHLKSWGWREFDGPHEYKEGVVVHKYNISTAGWSGNESIIHAMENNKHSLWWLNWVQSRRGGHYIFELCDMGDD